MTRFILPLVILVTMPLALISAEEEKAPINSFCPITPEEAVSSSSRLAEYEGEVYAFCCGACRDEFEEAPAKWAAIVKEQLAQQTIKTEDSATEVSDETKEPETPQQDE